MLCVALFPPLRFALGSSCCCRLLWALLVCFRSLLLVRARGPAPRLGVCIVKHTSAEPGFTTDVGCGKMRCGPVQDQFWFFSESLLVPPQAQHAINSIDIFRGAAYIPTHSPQHISLRLPTIRTGGIGSCLLLCPTGVTPSDVNGVSLGTVSQTCCQSGPNLRHQE